MSDHEIEALMEEIRVIILKYIQNVLNMNAYTYEELKIKRTELMNRR